MARTSKKIQAVKEQNKIPPAYFTSLEIENVLCFKDKQVLHLSDVKGYPAQWTVILGDNGVGKTTLLRCLARMEPYLARGVPNYDLGTMSRDQMLPLFYSLSEEELGTLYQSKVKIKANLIYGASLTDFKNLSPDIINRRTERISLDFSIMPSSSDERSSFPIDKDLFELKCYGYGATRKIGKATLSDASLNEQYYKETSASLFLENDLLINAEEWLLQADYSSKYSKGQKQKDLQKQINDIKEIFKKALPDVEDVDIFLDELQDSRPQLRFLMPYGWIPFVDMGLGYKTMMTWILDLVIRLYKRYPESDDPLLEPAIVLVDEIDLHLHPKWQRTIMEFLTKRFPNTQFIVTAHSPLVVQAAQDANIVLLRREGDRVVIDNNPEIIDNWRVDQILTTVFDLPSGRSAKLDPWLEERELILTKSHLTQEDKARLNVIAEEIGDLPTGENPEDIRAMDIIRRAAKLLEQQEKS